MKHPIWSHTAQDKFRPKLTNPASAGSTALNPAIRSGEPLAGGSLPIRADSPLLPQVARKTTIRHAGAACSGWKPTPSNPAPSLEMVAAAAVVPFHIIHQSKQAAPINQGLGEISDMPGMHIQFI